MQFQAIQIHLYYPCFDLEYGVALCLSEKPIRDRTGVQSPTYFAGLANEHQSTLKSDSDTQRHFGRHLESLIEVEQMQAKQSKLSGPTCDNKYETGDQMTKNVVHQTSSALSLQHQTGMKENQFSKIPIATLPENGKRLKSLESALEDDIKGNQLIEIPIETLPEDGKRLKSLESALEDDMKGNQLIEIPIETLPEDGKRLKSLESALEDDMKGSS